MTKRTYVAVDALLSGETIAAATRAVPAHDIDPPVTVRYAVQAVLDAVGSCTPEQRVAEKRLARESHWRSSVEFDIESLEARLTALEARHACGVCHGRDLGTTDGPDGKQWPRVCGACAAPEGDHA